MPCRVTCRLQLGTEYKINKRIPHLKSSQEARRENSDARVTQSILPTPIKSILHLQQEGTLHYYLSRRKKIPPCRVTAHPMANHRNSANEKSLLLSVSSNGLCLQQHLPSPIKSLPLDCMSQFALVCCSRINPFCWRNIYYLFKVNIIEQSRAVRGSFCSIKKIKSY